MGAICVMRAHFGARCRSGGWMYCAASTSLQQVVTLHYLVCLILLIIGNIELNPGPEQFMCNYEQCQAILSTLGQHALHQKLHANAFNFMFECGACKVIFSSYNSLSSHISKCHVEARTLITESSLAMSFHCTYCGEERVMRFQSTADLCRHLLNDHLGEDKGSVLCPLLKECQRTEPFSTRNAFSVHLSKCHPGWRDIKSTMSATASVNVEFPEAGPSHALFEEHVFCDDETGMNDSPEEEEEFFDAQDTIDCSDQDAMNFITYFYLMLEVECLLPVSTIDKISQSLTFISEVTQKLIRNAAVKELEALNIPRGNIRNIVSKLTSVDPLYLSHHKNTIGPDLVSDHLRKKHFNECFPQVPTSYPNFVPKEPIDGERYAFISPKDTLKLLLKDPSVKEEVLDSFERRDQDNSNILNDYTCGSVFKSRNLPKKRIDLIFFQDAFSTTSMMTSTQDKYKTLGMYMTLGNLKAWQRTKLNAMHLVMLVLEKHVKRHRQKCFTKIILQLKDLEENGTEFNGEMTPVFVQFVVGDNLGSHFLGGFVESFTTSHFCRYCELSKTDFQSDPTAIKPPRTPASYKRAALRVLAKDVKHYKGVKENSVFNKLSYFKVTDPGLPPCLGHDLFHGVVDVDLALILKSFIERGWITFHLLNRRMSQFKYALADLRNKPAPFKDGRKKEKLGGSAVQNWLLLRLLTYFIHDKIIDFNDGHWQLYLKLKAICEYVCAPEISLIQVDKLEVLILSYLQERSILAARPKPKHHFLRHYPQLIRQLGPLIHLWAMRFEQKHQYFKNVARASNNFINLLVTLSAKSQLLFSYQSQGVRFKSILTGTKPFHIKPNHFRPDVNSVINAHQFSPELKATEKVSVNGLKYRKTELLLLGQNPQGLLLVGYIEAILLDVMSVHFVIRNKTATFNADLGLHQINAHAGHLTLVNQNALLNPCTQPVYCIGDVDSFSLKHSRP